MTARRNDSWNASIPFERHFDVWEDPPLRELTLIGGVRWFAIVTMLVLLAVATITMAIIGVIFSAGGFDPGYVEPRYPRPDGYRFNDWRIEGHRIMCVDPRNGPAVEWSLLDMAEDAVATWKRAAPSLPLSISGICKSAGGNADDDGDIKWGKLDGLSGRARVHSGDVEIVLSPDLGPASWDCVRNVLLHETGHAIGLDHQPDVTPSIMNCSGCEHPITPLDVAAAQYLYEGRAKK